MALTNTKVLNSKSQDKPYKLYDEKGLFLLVHPNGSKYWRVKYRFSGKEKLYSIGLYPQFSLKEARNQRDDIKKQIANDVDPSQAKQLKKTLSKVAGNNSFEAVSKSWLEVKRPEWSTGYAD